MDYSNPAAHPSAERPRRAFTLLELILAITIFALVSVAVLAVFRTGTQAYTETNREMLMLQRSRYVFDTFEDDIMSLFYRDETSYNVESREMIQEYQQVRLEAERTGDWDEFERVYGPREGEADEEDRNDPNYIGNPFDKGKLIDLQFVGENHDEIDSITFAVHEPLELGIDYHFWGLSRVHYTVEGDFLIRSEESVETAPRDWQGEVLEKEEKPTHSIVARDVAVFDLSYAFWWDNQWYEVENWSSSNRQVRNPQQLLGEYDYDEDDVRIGQLQPGAPGWNDYLNELENQPLDRVPTYVRLRLGLTDPENEERVFEMTRIFRIPNSQETWVINEQIEEEDQEMEREMRDDEYTPVFPGALRKQ